jgi:hypothetical protein
MENHAAPFKRLAALDCGLPEVLVKRQQHPAIYVWNWRRGGIRTRCGIIQSATCRFYVTKVAIDALFGIFGDMLSWALRFLGRGGVRPIDAIPSRGLIFCHRWPSRFTTAPMILSHASLETEF